MKSYKSLPKGCKESSKILKEKRNLYEREGIFPAYVIDYVAALLEKENMDLTKYKTEEGLRKIMHRDLHKH